MKDFQIPHVRLINVAVVRKADSPYIPEQSNRLINQRLFPNDSKVYGLQGIVHIRDGIRRDGKCRAVFNRAHGYSFFALSDHLVYNFHTDLNTEDFLFYPSMEGKTIPAETNPACSSYQLYHMQVLQAPWKQADKPFEDGHFYASTGPEITHFEVHSGDVILECSPARKIEFITYPCRGHGLEDPLGANLICGNWHLPEGVEYVRAQVIDAEGRTAWTNPIFFDD